MFGRGELKPHTFPLRYSPLNGEMSALALTEGSVCASKRVIPLTREMSSLRDKRMTLAVDEVFSLFTSVKDRRKNRYREPSPVPAPFTEWFPYHSVFFSLIY